MACNHTDKVSYHNNDKFRKTSSSTEGSIWCDTCNVMANMPKMWRLPNAIFYAHRLRS